MGAGHGEGPANEHAGAPVGLLGLAINVAFLLLPHGGSKESLNVRGASFEVVADVAFSVGVMVAGVLGRCWPSWASMHRRASTSRRAERA